MEPAFIRGIAGIPGAAQVIGIFDLPANPAGLDRVYGRLLCGLRRVAESHPQLQLGPRLFLLDRFCRRIAVEFESNWKQPDLLLRRQTSFPVFNAFAAVIPEEIVSDYSVIAALALVPCLVSPSLHNTRRAQRVLTQLSVAGTSVLTDNHVFIRRLARDLLRRAFLLHGGEHSLGRAPPTARALRGQLVTLRRGWNPTSPPQESGCGLSPWEDGSLLRVDLGDGDGMEIMVSQPRAHDVPACARAHWDETDAPMRYFEACNTRSNLPGAWSRANGWEEQQAIGRSLHGSRMDAMCKLGLDLHELSWSQDADGATVITRRLQVHMPQTSFRAAVDVAHLYRPAAPHVEISMVLRAGEFDRPLAMEWDHDARLRPRPHPRVLRILENRIADRVADPVLQAGWFAPAHAHAGVHYVGTPATAARQMLEFMLPHCNVSIAGETPDHVLGSQGVPLLAPLKAHISATREHLLDLLARQDDAVAFHNAYCGYCVARHVAGCSARVVQDPFFSPAQFQKAARVCLCSDKVTSESHTVRPVAAASSVFAQNEAWMHYLASAAGRLFSTCSPLGMQVQKLLANEPAELALYFFIEEDEVVPVSQESFARHWAPAGIYHRSVFRHLGATWLREAGAPAELVEYHMGHWRRGEAPFAPDSPLSLAQWVAPLADSLQALLLELDFRVVELPRRGRGRPQRGRWVAPP